ncbi:DNA repair protein RecO [Bacteroidales bacterium OttesenSCG-928-M11]|nr:DNA repair protein RecO [Bacteroidales bacterium OttesenSCG-928-M11]
MLRKTKGIVLCLTNYNDRYSIVRVLTEEFGVLSYLTFKDKGKKAKTSRMLFHPLAALEMEVEHGKQDIHRLKEAKAFISFPNLLFDPIKSSICLFLAEFLNKTIRDIQPDKFLFNYLLYSLEILELSSKNYTNFHLVFLIRLSQFLGFYPNAEEYCKGMYFDLQKGYFVSHKPFHNHFLNPEDSSALALLLRMNYHNMHCFKLSGSQRYTIINQIIEYYRLHLSYLPEIKSMDILHEIFK